MALLSGFFRLGSPSRRANGIRSAPSTPQRNPREATEESLTPFRIPNEKNDHKKNIEEPAFKETPPQIIITRASRGSSSTVTPPESPARSHSLGASSQRKRPADLNCDMIIKNEPTIRSSPTRVSRSGSFTHVRCLNCNQQFIVNNRTSPKLSQSSNLNGDFCSGECRCSFLATGIDQQYNYKKDSSVSFVFNNSDDEEMNLDDEDENDDDDFHRDSSSTY